MVLSNFLEYELQAMVLESGICVQLRQIRSYARTAIIDCPLLVKRLHLIPSKRQRLLKMFTTFNLDELETLASKPVSAVNTRQSRATTPADVNPVTKNTTQDGPANHTTQVVLPIKQQQGGRSNSRVHSQQRNHSNSLIANTKCHGFLLTATETISYPL